jgi:hypothetical protein
VRSIFLDKDTEPTQAELKKALGETYSSWKKLEKTALKFKPDAVCAWNFAGEKYGWSYRISDAKRVLIYLLPRDKFFKVAFVFGAKAYDTIMSTSIAPFIKTELKNAKPYAEGRGIRMEIKDASLLMDLAELINIKMNS